MKMVRDCGEEQLGAELVHLCINLAANRSNAQIFCEGPEPEPAVLIPESLFYFIVLLFCPVRERSEAADEEGLEAEGRSGDEDDQESVSARRNHQEPVSGPFPPSEWRRLNQRG